MGPHAQQLIFAKHTPGVWVPALSPWALRYRDHGLIAALFPWWLAQVAAEGGERAPKAIDCGLRNDCLQE
jgi:hypothetical protein